MTNGSNHFAEMAAINVNEHVDKKGQLSYLSWPWAVDQLLRRDPDASWVYSDYPVKYGDTMMVVCTVTAFGKARTMQLPVMDYKNKAIANPDAFQVNTAMQRCLVKAIALHGLGLYIYAGEDLPPGEVADETVDKNTGEVVGERIRAANITGAQVAKDALTGIDPEEQTFLRDHAMEIIALHDRHEPLYDYVERQNFDTEERLALWSLLPSAVRTAYKKQKALAGPSLAEQA